MTNQNRIYLLDRLLWRTIHQPLPSDVAKEAQKPKDKQKKTTKRKEQDENQ